LLADCAAMPASSVTVDDTSSRLDTCSLDACASAWLALVIPAVA
jgi:hypothetical protein